MMEISVSRAKIAITIVFSAVSGWSFDLYMDYLKGLDNLLTPAVLPTMAYLLYYLFFSILFGWTVVGSVGSYLLALVSNVPGLRALKRLTKVRTFSLTDGEGSVALLPAIFLPVMAGLAFTVMPERYNNIDHFDYFVYISLGWGGATLAAYKLFYDYIWRSRRQYKEEASYSLRYGHVLISFDLPWFMFTLAYLTHFVICTKMFDATKHPIFLIVGGLPLVMFLLLLLDLALFGVRLFISRIFFAKR